jgi:hypothetical protein
MTEIIEWFQSYWVDLASLLVQCAILATVVRFSRKMLATLRASQEQVGALLRLSVSDAVAEQPAPTPQPRQQFEPAAVNFREPEREPEPEPEPVLAGAFSRENHAAEREHTLGGRVIGEPAASYPTLGQRPESPSLTPWVSAPVTEPVRASLPAAPPAARPSGSSWLQAPMRSSGVNPLRKVLRWLQAPAGH